jgi:DNA ligase-1
MKRFTRLYTELDQTNRTNEKVAALESYFREADPRDAAWALHFLCGRRPPRSVTSTELREWAAEEAGLPQWLVEECYETVGDLGETVALLLPKTEATSSLSLHEIVEQRLLPMRNLVESEKKKLLLRTWRELNAAGRLIWNKLITGGFRVGVAQTLVARALAKVAGIDQSVMTHHLMGQWQPTSTDYERILNRDENAGTEMATPYPFFLASPLEGEPSALGDIREWQLEWKWDGIRAQLIRRGDEVLIWTRGDELVTPTFPEIAGAGHIFSEGAVLDGEILAWKDDLPQPFARLQRRLGRKTASAKLQTENPVVFLAYDLLEWDSEDWRTRPLEERRRQLEIVIERAVSIYNASGKTGRSATGIGETHDLFPPDEFTPTPPVPLRISTLLHPASWEELAKLQAESRSRQVEGIMLKRLTSHYGTGRQRGDWWKWKIDPLVIDAVLINAQAGHGRRANLYTDYTFGVWSAGKLVPIAKAYSGLDDAEILEVDKFIRANTTGKFGPIRTVTPVLVFELAFEAVQESTRHKTGIAVRFPRISRWRHDKKPEEADTLENLKALSRTPQPS